MLGLVGVAVVEREMEIRVEKVSRNMSRGGNAFVKRDLSGGGAPGARARALLFFFLFSFEFYYRPKSRARLY